MPHHECSQKCFETHQTLIKKEVYVKVQRYEKSDKYLRTSTCETISPQSAYDLLKLSNGKCTDCNKQLLLHHWKPLDPSQFSFDRISDQDSHNWQNLRITCLGCNMKKADEMYKPSSVFERNQYNLLRDEYFLLTKLLNKNPTYRKLFEENRSNLDRTCRVYHDKVYGDRKKSSWTTTKSDKPLSKPDPDFVQKWSKLISPFSDDQPANQKIEISDDTDDSLEQLLTSALAI